jgi:serine/threonine protein kinase
LNESFILSAAAEWDRKTLRESLSSSHICDGEICTADLADCLTKQVLDKLDAEEQVSRDPNNFRDLIKPEHLPKGKGKKLGEGSFAKVREIEWLGQKFAQKIFSHGTRYNKSFKEEIAAMAGLDHPNIIHAVCCSEDNRRLSIVMELMYKSLHQLLQQDCTSPLSIFQAIDLMLQISEGLRYLHGKNIAHRDLKSLNILVQFADPQPDIRSDGMVNVTTNTLFVAKVADFGLAKVKNTSTMLGNQTTDVGTTRWMAPEAPSRDAMGSPSDRFHPMKVDIYSFGIICYEILSREQPFDGLRGTQLRDYVKAGNRPQLPDEIPPRLDILIRDCWDGNPLHRPDFAAICTELRFIKRGLLSGGKH